MKAVWSFWSKPYFSGRKAFWATELHHWLSWVLSLETVRQHYPETCLYTDERGADILVDGLGLSFASVNIVLDDLASADADWWALGKLYAYSRQSEPFVHLDNDVFLWKPLPEYLETAAVFAQNPEFLADNPCYRPEQLEDALHKHHAWLPPEWLWFRQESQPQRAECCGILGGCNTEFIRHYANLAVDWAQAKENTAGWNQLADKPGHMILLEQYLLSACLEYRKAHGDSSLSMRYVFDTPEQAYDRDTATARGYTHLIADAKRNPAVTARLQARVQAEYPKQYEKCLRYVNA